MTPADRCRATAQPSIAADILGALGARERVAVVARRQLRARYDHQIADLRREARAEWAAEQAAQIRRLHCEARIRDLEEARARIV